MAQAQVIQEIIVKKLDEASDHGYKPNYHLFRELQPREVPAFRESAYKLEGYAGQHFSEACEVWHPVTRLQMIQILMESLIAQGEF
ncbi:unnamed protein product [marine sediment metagenome]|uniref:Uncharacterized protein n=1 Tax=marine sediment metagenome TaxID=412755 RepID=X1KBE6_9ZZZZ